VTTSSRTSTSTRPAHRPAALRLLLLIALLLLPSGGALAQGTRPAPPGPWAGGPVVVDIRAVPRTNGQEQRRSLPWAHPGGAALLAREKAEALQRGAGRGVQAPPAAAPTTAAPALSFDGINSDQSQCGGCYPPDGAVATGPTYVVGAVNTAVAVWNKSGNVVIPPVSLPNFLASDPNCPNNFFYGFSDPFVDYDETAGHYVMGMLNFDLFFDSTVCIAVTATNDPTGFWYIYDFPVDPAMTLFDFPHAAVGSDAIYVSGNLFDIAGTFLGARVYAYQKDVMYAGVPPQSPPSAYRDVATRNAAGEPVDTLIPAQGVGAASTMYFTAADNCNGCGTVRLWKWSAPFGGNLFASQGGVGVQAYDQPPEAAQLGGAPIATNDTRELAASWYNGTVYGVHTIACDPGGGTVACLQWYQLGNLDGPPSLLQQGIYGTSGQYRYFPTLAVGRAGDLALGYAYSSPTDYAGVRYTSLPAGSATLDSEQTLVAGQTAIITTGADGRYGDYGDMAVDPADGCTVWLMEEYAQAGQLWGTRVGAFQLGGCSAPPPPDFSLSASPGTQTVTAGGSGAYTVTLTALNGFTGSAALSVTSPLPAGVSASFSPTSVSASAPSTLTVSTSGTTPAGNYTLTITGVSGSLSHQTAVQLNVQDFAIAANPAALTVTAGSGATSTITLTALNGYNASVALSVTGPFPVGMSAGVNPGAVTPTGTSTLTVATTAATPAGTYSLAVTGTGAGGTAHSTTVAVTVSPSTPAADFTITVTPASRSVAAGSPTTYTVTVTALNGYSSPVTLSVTGQPPSAKVSWSPVNPVTPTANGAPATLTITPKQRGTFTLTIIGTGAGGTPVRSQQVTLIVTSK
jgi:hypothetical protein